jgi:FlgD Ig-like domain
MPATRTGYAVVAVLIVASGGAFLRAEQLKLERSPVASPRITKHLSTTCKPGPHCVRVAVLRFALRTPATLELTLVNSSGRTVRTFTPAAGRPYSEGTVSVSWDGRTQSGSPAADGRYRLRVDLVSLDRAITIPDPVVLDTVAPTLTLSSRPGQIPVRYAVSEQARVYLSLRPADGSPGTVLRGRRGRVLVPAADQEHGATMTLVAVDAAGNVSAPLAAGAMA